MTKCADVYELFFALGEVTEIRAYGLSRSNKAWEGFAGGAGVVYGYFDNAEAFGKAAGALEAAKAHGIYFTLNPVIPDLLARAANRLKAAGQKSILTHDKDVFRIRWLPIDIDPVCPAKGISSTQKELDAAFTIRDRIAEWLEQEIYCPPGIRACSGNGAHLVYQLPKDCPNSEENSLAVKRVLEGLANKFQNRFVTIDLAVFNPARIWKLYGTTARKGDHTEQRPHRKSYIENRKEE